VKRHLTAVANKVLSIEIKEFYGEKPESHRCPRLGRWEVSRCNCCRNATILRKIRRFGAQDFSLLEKFSCQVSEKKPFFFCIAAVQQFFLDFCKQVTILSRIQVMNDQKKPPRQSDEA
jgi:predicted RNA-binding Zn-ribbon protein involved in translation (DUF1610 family)